jgi:NAD(P)-dependent dehydrogenase (short-subunit alcohol dehydrogenase family)
MNPAPMNLSLAGMRALVTAGASGIGLAIAEALIECGARVHVCDVSGDFLAEFRKTHPEAVASRADVASEADVERLFIEVEKNLGGLDVLVNNAALPVRPAGSTRLRRPTGAARSMSVSSASFYARISACRYSRPPAAARSSTCLRRPAGSAMRFARPIPPPNGVSSA